MRPFDDYPGAGKELLGRLHNLDNCRHGYGRDLQLRTGQTRCAYCGVNLTDEYYHWLLMCIDHVVPVSAARRLDIPEAVYSDIINLVLCCSGCNGFINRYDFACERRRDKWTVKEFVKLRDRIFAYRKCSIADRRADEMHYFDHKPWTHTNAQQSSSALTSITRARRPQFHI